MARRRNETSNDDTLVDAVEVKEGGQSFLEENQNLIFGAIVAAVVLFGMFFAYNNYYKQPRMKAAADQMYQAQVQFEKDSFAVALSNPGGGFDGFLGIIENYSGTPAANSAHYYAGICHLQLGDFNKALEFLGDYSPDGEVMPIMKYGAMGDAHSELNQMDQALSMYNKAVNQGGSDLLEAYYWKKIGLWNEQNKKYKLAHDAYKTIKEKYPTTPEANDINKYLTRVNARL